MLSINEKVVVLTGASSGIGEATARMLGRKGARVVLGARRRDRLERIASDVRAYGGTAEVLEVDVTKREDVESLVRLAKERFGRLDVLVNNAGVMPMAPLSALRVDEWNRMIDVNVRGVLHGIAAALPIMKEQGFGQFVNVSSVAGRQVFPLAAVYCATKFAVHAISEGLRQETKDIRVTVITPGATESELARTTSDEDARTALVEIRKDLIPGDAIARAIVFAIDQPDGVDVNEVVVRPTASTW